MNLLRFGKSLGPLGKQVAEIKLLKDANPDILERRFERIRDNKKHN